MRKILLAIAFVVLFIRCSTPEQEVYMFSFFQNNGADGLHLAYSYDGQIWTALNRNKSFLTPIVGNDKLMRDPCIIKGGDDKFHMVWTISWGEKGIGYANSVDLISWSDQKYIPVMEHEELARNCWAPELFYNKKENQYMIYWSTTIPGKYPDTDTLGDSGYNHRIYYCKTKDFIDFSSTEILYDDGFNVIDAHIRFIDDNYVVFLKNETLKPKPEKNIRIATSKNLYGNYSSASKPITKNWVEGPTAIKINNNWIVCFDIYTENVMGAIISNDLINWDDISDKIKFPKGTRHGSIFTVKESLLNKLLEI